MDHAIESLSEFLKAELTLVRREWKSGKYNKLSDCPSFDACQALVDAIHRLELYEYGEHRTTTVKQLVD